MRLYFRDLLMTGMVAGAIGVGHPALAATSS